MIKASFRMIEFRKPASILLSLAWYLYSEVIIREFCE
jgi:hypothetical protein